MSAQVDGGAGGGASEPAEGAGGETTWNEEGDALGMFYRMSAERLRARCVGAGAALVLSLLVPYEVIAGHGIFVWSVIAELDWAGRIAAVMPAVAGLFLLLLGVRTERRAGLVIVSPTSRAIAVIAAFVAVNAVLWIGARSSAWGLLPLPDSLTTRPAPFLLVFALTSSGAVLRFHRRARKAGSVLLLASMVAALVFYLWPSRGEIPAQTIARAVVIVATLPDVRFVVGSAMVLLFVLGPLVIALLGLVYVRGVPRREHPGISIAAVWGVPALMLLFVYRAFLAGGAGAQAVSVAFFAVLLVTVVAALASAIEVLALGIATPESELPWGGARPIVAAGGALAGVLALCAATFVLGRPAPKGVDWKLGAPSAEWDKVMGELVPGWDRARVARDEHARAEGGTGAEAQVATKARSREMVAAARGAPDGREVAGAMETLAREVDDLELSGRAFGRLVGDVNDAARRAGLPYYLDPQVRVLVSKEGTRRLFHVSPYRVKEVHGYRVGGDRFATLIVEPMTGGGRVHLGFSRDQDPFALVLRSEIDAYAERVSAEGAGCHAGKAEGEQAAALARCDVELAKLRRRLGVGMAQAVLSATERHELQHQIDGPHLPLSGEVAELLAGFSDEAQDRANRELSAYIAEMTAEGAPPQLTLVHLFPFGVVARGGAEHRVAVLLLETLSGRKLRFGARRSRRRSRRRSSRGGARRRGAPGGGACRAYRVIFRRRAWDPVRE
ncbi:MAG: hypothetical protein R3F14_03745 [Polyangiaceae bacterium]